MLNGRPIMPPETEEEIDIDVELLDDYPDGAEDPDEYSDENVFWMPKEW